MAQATEKIEIPLTQVFLVISYPLCLKGCNGVMRRRHVEETETTFWRSCVGI